MTIAQCPGCKHNREAHKDGSCYRLVEAVTAGGETHLTLCGYCGWVATINENGSRGWRHEAGRKPEPGEEVDRGEVTVEAETLEQALLEVGRIMGLR